MGSEDEAPATRRRRAWLAAVLMLANPIVGMLYVDRPHRAAVYFGLFLLGPFGAFVLARNGLWPAGISWIPVLFLVALVGVVDAYRIARQYEHGFAGGWFTTWKGLLAVAVVSLVVIFGFRAFLFEPFRTPSVAMLPTLKMGDEFFVSKLAFRGAPVQRGDVVVFRLPGKDVAYVKRVIGLPGDVIVYDQTSKSVTINGSVVGTEPLGASAEDGPLLLARETIGDRSHSVAVRQGFPGLGGTYRVPDGHYFVLGDNRDNSRDSRFSDFGFIPAENIFGKVIFVWWNTGDPRRAGIAIE
jgi:signal peptidase I